MTTVRVCNEKKWRGLTFFDAKMRRANVLAVAVTVAGDGE